MQKAGSLLSSVAILYHQLDDLDAAVQTSLDHLKELVGEFDRTADAVLKSIPAGSSEFAAVSKDIDSMRTVNTGNLNWRYVVHPEVFITLCSFPWLPLLPNPYSLSLPLPRVLAN